MCVSVSKYNFIMDNNTNDLGSDDIIVFLMFIEHLND